MKMRKKFALLLLGLIMTLAMGTTAFAATITVNGLEGKTYTAYKIFDVVWQDKEPTGQGENDGYGYSISSTSEWYSLVKEYADVADNKLTLTESATAGTYTVNVEDGFDAAKFAEHLLGTEKANLEGKTKAAYATIEAGKDSAELTVADPGYYLINTDLGALCILKTAAGTVTVNEKNSQIPGVVKKVEEDKTGVFGETNTTEIGQEVTFQATVAVKYNPKNYVFHDKMDAGLTYKEVKSVKVGKDENVLTDVPTDKYTVKTKTEGLKDSECTFEITFDDDYLKDVVGENIVITYTAVLNENAKISTDVNENTAKLSYQDDQHFTEESVTKTYTYEFDLVKKDEAGKPLKGAEFKLYDAATEGNVINLKKVDDTTYRVATADDKETTDTIVIPEGGVVKIKGLDNKTYYLEETKAPAGYNPLAGRKTVDLSSGNLNLDNDAFDDGKYDDSEGGVQVVNKTGSMLPETGAAGKVMFISIGTIVVLGAGVLLVTKKRMNMIR